MAEKLSPKERFNNAVISINSTLGSILNPIRKGLDEYYQNHNSVKVTDIPPCGIYERQPKYSPSDAVIGESRVDQIVQEIKNDPLKWGDLQELNPEMFNVGSGVGNQSGRTPVREITYPKWLNEIESEAKLFFRRGKKKNYYDIESLTRGVPRKQKEKGKTMMKSLYVLLDVSGSMWMESFRGIPLIELMIRYFPHIARKFEGELWEVDGGEPTIIIPLKNLRSSDMSDMQLVGGGGTDYNTAFSMLNDKKKLLEATGENVDFLTIVFTDGQVFWNEKVMPNNLVIVAPSTMGSSLPKDDASINRKAILIDIDVKNK